MNPLDPERLGLASASSFARTCACPGSPAAIAALPPNLQEEPKDEVTTSGTKVHRALETGDTSDLDEDELALFKKGVENERQLMERWATDNKLGADITRAPAELRLWLHDESTLKPIASGQLDAHYISLDGKHILIIDTKSGFAFAKLNSATSHQLRLQAVLAAKEYPGVEKIRVAYNKLKARAGGNDFTDYTLDDLRNAESEARFIIWNASQPGAQRTPGDHCSYCPCKPNCAEAAAMSLLPSVLSQGGVMERVDELAPQDLRALWERGSIIRKVLDRVSDRLKLMTDEELAGIGIEKVKGRKLDTFTNVKGAFEKLLGDDVPELSIWPTLKFSKGELVDMLREQKKLSKVAATEYVERELAAFYTRAEGEKMLKAKEA